jgi:hypothetical protein
MQGSGKLFALGQRVRVKSLGRCWHPVDEHYSRTGNLSTLDSGCLCFAGIGAGCRGCGAGLGWASGSLLSIVEPRPFGDGKV